MLTAAKYTVYTRTYTVYIMLYSCRL